MGGFRENTNSMFIWHIWLFRKFIRFGSRRHPLQFGYFHTSPDKIHPFKLLVCQSWQKVKVKNFLFSQQVVSHCLKFEILIVFKVRYTHYCWDDRVDSLTESDGGDSIILGWQGAATVFNINLFILNLHIIIYYLW